MKRRITIVTCLIGVILMIITVSAQQPAWQEGFETYTSGSFPSSWVPDGNASDINTNYVTTSAYLSGEKSLQLFGVLGGCWAAIAYHELAISPPFEIEVAVRNGNESLTGCNPDRVSIHLRQGTLWQNPARVLINFKGDGTITSASGNVLQTYETLAWYTIKIRYERPTPAQVEISYWINGNYKSKETLELVNSEDLMTNLELSVLEGTAWFDDMKVTPAQAILDIRNSGAIPKKIPVSFILHQNYPNPFNPSTTISYQIPEESYVTLKVFDILGRELAVLVNEEKPVGIYNIKYDATNLSSGIYFYTIKAGDFIQTKKFILLK